MEMSIRKRTKDSQKMDRILFRLCNYESCGDSAVLGCNQNMAEGIQSFMRKLRLDLQHLNNGGQSKLIKYKYQQILFKLFDRKTHTSPGVYVVKGFS